MRVIVVTAYLILCNAIFAGMIFVAFSVGQVVVPDAMENPFFVLAFGIAVLACFWKFISRATEFMISLRSRSRS